MYGKNTEGMIASLGAIITAATNAMKILANGVNYRNQSINHIHTIDIKMLTTEEADGPGGHRHEFEISNKESNERFNTVKNDNDPDGVTELWEKEEENKTSAPAMKSAPGMGDIAKAMYVSTGKMNNSVGSPFTELSNLNTAITSYNSFANGANMKYMGGKVAAIAMLSTVISLAVDAKQSIMTYHDFVERGAVYVRNGNKQNIKWDQFSNVTADKKTDGNIFQQTVTNEWGSE